MKTNTRIDVSNAPDYLVERLVEAGYDAYYVGGAVRDSLLGIAPKDWDIATNANPDEVVNLFSNTNKVALVEAAVAFPVVLVDGFEVATFRKDVPGASRAENSMTLSGSMKDDAMRRDFTVNALYADRWGYVYDPTGLGLSDLQAVLLRFVGEPMQRIDEDPVRLLRAVRFASKLKFNLEENTAAALLSTELYFR